MFSPYYFAARQKSEADPQDHCALNVALYGSWRKHWAMTESGRANVSRSLNRFAIGPSALHWDGATLTIDIDERATPVPTRLRGRVRVTPTAMPDYTARLDAEGKHRWRPLAPCARVDVTFDQPRLRWAGPGYLDHNDGDGPLENSFVRWTWSRASQARATSILYDVTRRDGSPFSLAAAFDDEGNVKTFASPPIARLPRTRWQLARQSRSQDSRASVMRTLEDTPFYARSVISAKLDGGPVTAVHESLSLDRFRSPLMQAMLPYRMPRR